MSFNSKDRKGDRFAGSSAHSAPNRGVNHRFARGGRNPLKTLDSPVQPKSRTNEAFAQLSASQKDVLARQLGYDSFDRLLQASTVVTLSDGSVWWMTADRNGAWTAWNLCALQSPPTSHVSGTAAASG
jgi:hypothetical protein